MVSLNFPQNKIVHVIWHHTAEIEVLDFDNEGNHLSFCCQVAALFPDMLCSFNLVKNLKKIAKKSTTAKTREKISAYLESVEF
jgi:hypothetical protein